MTKCATTMDEPSWLSESKKNYRELYVELDAILKAIDRFFSLENLPIDKDVVSEKNFARELIIVRDSILRALSILEVVLPEDRKNAYWFGKFAETVFYSDFRRDHVRGQMYSGADPEKCVFLLYDALVNFKSIVNDVLKSRRIGYISFKNIGDIIGREIRDNGYLNPFRLEVNPELDRIEIQKISDIVRSIQDRRLRRTVSMSFIFLFRLLRYLNCIDITTKRNIAVSCGLLILTLLRSEIRQLTRFFEGQIAGAHVGLFHDPFQAVLFQLSMEQKRVYNQELKHILQMKNVLNLRGKIENSHGILKNMFEQCIVQIASVFEPSLKGDEIFSSFITKLGQSQKLREDIFILHRILSLLDRNISNRRKRTGLYESLKNFMLYFESFTFRLLRHDDYEEFVAFFGNFLTDFDIGNCTDDELNTFSDKLHNFKIFLDTSLGHINNRTELQGTSIDIEKTERLLRQYIQ